MLSVITFFGVVILFSIVLNAYDKIKAYKDKDKSVWIDGDSVRIKRNLPDEDVQEDGFMKRIS